MLLHQPEARLAGRGSADAAQTGNGQRSEGRGLSKGGEHGSGSQQPCRRRAGCRAGFPLFAETPALPFRVCTLPGPQLFVNSNWEPNRVRSCHPESENQGSHSVRSGQRMAGGRASWEASVGSLIYQSPWALHATQPCSWDSRGPCAQAEGNARLGHHLSAALRPPHPITRPQESGRGGACNKAPGPVWRPCHVVMPAAFSPQRWCGR